MPRPLTGLLVAVVFCALVGAAYAVQNVALGRPAAEQSPLDPVPDADDGEQLVVLFGDSLLEAAVDQLRVRFAADPDRRLSAHWYGGTEVDTTAWLELYPHVGEGTEVLLALGVNDVFNGSVADATGDVARVLDALTEAGASRVIMPTITLNRLTTATTLDDRWYSKVAEYNTWLIAAGEDEERFPTLQVLRWDEISAGHPEWLQHDGVHLTLEGGAAYADALFDAVATPKVEPDLSPGR
ncbi:MAG TPA: GDSL-type esterase/lipase family protein [Acidimicrobiales bacterium]